MPQQRERRSSDRSSKLRLKGEGKSSRDYRKKRLRLSRLWKTRLSGWKRKRKKLARGCLRRGEMLKKLKLRDMLKLCDDSSRKLWLTLLRRPQPPQERTKATSE